MFPRTNRREVVMAKVSITKSRTNRLIEGSQNTVRQRLDALQDKFGRDAGPEDPVFIDPLFAIPDSLEVDSLQI